ncbi:MAG: 4-hydroxy-tetrahydrodipicolinate reductase [Crocinitomicaceae bacterium]|nr:4-hydroxy-tetrahydrodipicolinate reductase [Crocinitomicaceae bacterium]|tara:strand:- start:3272 stop:3979 length:708 start_codon:yes stop_codon:yes gene_type:complete
MKITLIGYGKMGRLVEKKAKERNHIITNILDSQDWNLENLKGCDMAIDFSTPDSVINNIRKSFKMGIPIIVGTTGWNQHFQKVKDWCKNYNGAILSASNFSLGVNVFFEINRHLSKIMNNYPSYNIYLNETHHLEKRDSPSGTAITTAEIILSDIDKYKNWDISNSKSENIIPIIAKRESDVSGIHEVVYENFIDEIKVSHKAKSREGFALGALIAAEFLLDKKGFYTMEDVLKF